MVTKDVADGQCQRFQELVCVSSAAVRMLVVAVIHDRIWRMTSSGRRCMMSAANDCSCSWTQLPTGWTMLPKTLRGYIEKAVACPGKLGVVRALGAASKAELVAMLRVTCYMHFSSAASV